jgi:hypothetical protein
MTRLRSLDVTIETKVTATPLPEIRMQCLNGRLPKVFELRPHRNYVGVEKLKLIEELDCESMDAGFLMKKFVHKENNKDKPGLFPKDKQQWAKKFPICGGNRRIPDWNEQCNRLIKSAFEENMASERTGALVLVGTCTWVERKNNIFQQAAGVQDLFGARKRNSFRWLPTQGIFSTVYRDNDTDTKVHMELSSLAHS